MTATIPPVAPWPPAEAEGDAVTPVPPPALLWVPSGSMPPWWPGSGVAP